MSKTILYFCSFVPVNVLTKAGFTMVSAYDLLWDQNGGPVLPGSPCSYIKMCSGIDFSRYDGVITTNCCNSTQRLYDYVCYHYPEIFSYHLEVPRTRNESRQNQGLFRELSRHFQMPSFSVEKKDRDREDERTVPVVKINKKKLLIFTSCLQKSYGQELHRIFAKYDCQIEACSNKDREMGLLPGKVSCPRMADYFDYIREGVKEAVGVICISMMNCDQMLFAYPGIREICRKQQKKCLVVEEESINRIPAGSRIRYEAFRECLELGKVCENEK